jgi:hypothetical protein
VSDDENMEERLRRTFRAVADLPGRPPSASGPPTRKGRRGLTFPVLQHPRLVATIISVAAIAAAVSLLVAYGPHNPSGPVSHPNVPAIQPGTSTTSTPPTTVPPATTTTATTVPVTSVGTEQITYQPFVGSRVDPSLQVTGQQSGDCFELGGGADGRIYYRCIGTSDVLQPCFAGPQGTSAPLVCPDGLVTSNKVILWTATSVDTTGFVPATTRTPWTMQLSNGMICEFVSAAWGGLGPYGCSTPGITTPTDCRAPQPSTPQWTADCQDQQTDASPFTPATVEKVWF